MFRTDLLSIIRSLNTVFTATGIFYTSYVDCLLVLAFIIRNMIDYFVFQNTLFWSKIMIGDCVIDLYKFQPTVLTL